MAEMRRTPGRFGAIIGTVVLIVFLELVLSALADGLYYGASGAIRTSGADLYVFSKDGRKDLTRSTLKQSDAALVAGVPGVAHIGEVGILQGTGRGPRGVLDLAVFGYLPGRPGGPAKAESGRVPRTGENGVAVGDVSLKDKGVHIGDRITVSGTSVALLIVGFTSDSRYELQPTLWASVSTWQTIRSQARPELSGQKGIVQSFVVTLARGASPASVAAAIDAASSGATQTITRGATVLALPGVAQQRTTFTQIVDTTFLVAAIVVALYFALITLEKRTLLAVLKAIGASSRYLAISIVAQSLIVCATGVVLGVTFSRLLPLVIPASVPVTFRVATAISVGIATLLTGVIGAAFSFRQITRIDPASALGGS